MTFVGETPCSIKVPMTKIPTKIVYTIWIFSTMFLSLAYFSDFRAVLLAVNYEAPIDTISDIVNLGRALYLMKGTSLENMFKTSTLPHYQRAYKELYLDRKADSTIHNGWIDLAIEDRIIKDQAVICADKETMQMRYHANVARYGYNPFRNGQEIVFSSYCGFAINKYFQWKDQFDMALHQMVDMGIPTKLIRNYIPIRAALDYEAPIQRKNDKIDPLSIYHLAVVCIILSIGLILAFVTFILEMSLNACVMRKHHTHF